jgi:hypothetical protein
MKVPFCTIAGLFLMGLSVSAQTDTTAVIFGPPLSPDLIQYLGLNDNQATAIRQANNSYFQFTMQKSLRSSQVQNEIAVETARPTLDPMALGLRYLELEAIQREIATEEARTRTTVQAILTDAQKTKIKALEDAMRLQPLICDAQSARILAPPAFVSVVTGSILPFPFLLSGRNLLNAFPPGYGCAFFGLGNRVGGVTFQP